MAKSRFVILVLIASCIVANVALKVRKIPPADGGQCGKPDAEDDGGSGSGGETCGGKPSKHNVIRAVSNPQNQDP